MKVGIGTVQFGIDYGISNRDGQTSREEAARILELGAERGIRILDTAALYGDSESVLGELLGENHHFKVVTKSCRFVSPRITDDHVRALEEGVHRSLQRLKQPSVYGLLLHHADDLLDEDGERLMDALRLMQQRGLVAKVGASVYTPAQVEGIMERFSIDLIQVPVNVLDQRLIRGGQLAALKAAGVEVHARSAFLQGLLLMEPDTLPAHFQQVCPLLRRFRGHLEERGLTPIEAALGFVLGLKEVDSVICGFNTSAQLEEVCARLTQVELSLFEEFAVEDEKIINPSQWEV